MDSRVLFGKIAILLLMIIPFSCGSGEGLIKIDRYHYPYLSDFMDGYQMTYLKRPDSAHDLLNYMKKDKTPHLKYTISKFKKNVNNIKWKKNDRYWELVEDNHIISDQVYPFEPDEYARYPMPSYLFQVHCFDKKGNPVKEDFNKMVKREIKKIGNNYSYSQYIYKSDDGEERLLAMEFDPVNQLRPFYERDKIFFDGHPYFKDINVYFKKLSERHKLTRIFFMTTLCSNDSIVLQR